MIQSFIDTMISGQRYMLIVQGLGITILIAICAILIGTVLGFIFALMKVSGNKILKPIAELYTTILRGIPLATIAQSLGHSNELSVQIYLTTDRKKMAECILPLPGRKVMSNES